MHPRAAAAGPQDLVEDQLEVQQREEDPQLEEVQEEALRQEEDPQPAERSREDPREVEHRHLELSVQTLEV